MDMHYIEETPLWYWYFSGAALGVSRAVQKWTVRAE
jgi:hypothetical protein